MLRPISKWAHSIYKPETIPEMVRKAFKIAEQEKPGVTVLELPEDIAKKEVLIEKKIKVIFVMKIFFGVIFQNKGFKKPGGVS